MKKYLLISTLILFILFVLTGCITVEENDSTIKFKESLLSNVKVQYVRDETNLLINNNIADILIKQTDTDRVSISLSKEVQGINKDKVHEFLDQINYDIHEENNNIIINSTNYDEIQKEITDLNIDCTIEVPKQITSLNILSKQGNISINGKYNEINVKLSKGNVEINEKKQTSNDFKILEKSSN